MENSFFKKFVVHLESEVSFMLIKELFDVDVARSKSVDDYPLGDVPFITNTELNNGVVAYVEPTETDKVFEGPAICVSGLGHATVHLKEFLPKGNGGDSCTILVPRTDFDWPTLLYYAALFNVLHKWRFSYGRKASKRRIVDLDLAPVYGDCGVDVAAEVDSNIKMIAELIDDKGSAIAG